MLIRPSGNIHRNGSFPGRYLRLAVAMTLATGIVFASGCSSTGGMKSSTSVHEAMPATMDNAKALYQDGKYAEAAVMLRELADKGDPAAQYALGYLRYYGQGVEQNTDMALDWFRLSASKGFQKAQEALQRHQLLYSETDTKPDLKIDTPIITKKPEPAARPGAMAGSAPMDSVAAPAALAPSTVVSRPVAASAVAVASSAPASSSSSSSMASRPTSPSADSVGWIRAQDPSATTVQLVSVSTEQAAKDYIAQNRLQGEAVYFPSLVGGRTIYSVIAGSYGSRGAAQAGLSGLPSSVGKANAWLRSFKSVQDALAR